MDDAFALLRLQVDWGADEALQPDPVDRMRPAEAIVVPVVRPVAVPTPLGAPRGSAAERALAAATGAATVEELRAALGAFDGCGLRDTASNLVFAEGDPASTTLLIGEPPGREEDRGGRPFAGAEGQLLDKMLASIGLNRAELMLTPVVPWRPPGGRPVNATELTLCLPFLHRLIGLLELHQVVIFGGTASRAVLAMPPTRKRVTPSWIDLSIPGLRESLPCLCMPSLGDMLKTPALRRDTWVGLRLLRRRIDKLQLVL